MASKTIRTHFTDNELDCNCGCGKTVDPELLTRLEALRRMLGQPLIVTSGARCATHNRKVGGKPASWHLKGLAVDISCNDSKLRCEIIQTATLLGFNGIGIAKNFIHLDLRPETEEVCFLYD